MTEWDLQRVLTKQWAESGLLLNGERQFLVGWEIMPRSWRVNDPKRHWNEPSLDFLVVDRTMRATVIELKLKLSGIKPVWEALCQVSHRAHQVGISLSLATLQKGHQNCWGGDSGKIGRIASVACDLVESHQMFFRLKDPVTTAPSAVRPCIAACSFSEQFDAQLTEFNAMTDEQLRYRIPEELTSKKSARERERFLACLGSQHSIPREPVIRMEL